jgi:hypothetical protein
MNTPLQADERAWNRVSLLMVGIVLMILGVAVAV